MTRWQDFEAEAFRYLRSSYSNQGRVNFIHEGGSNSHTADIKVRGERNEMIIEVKSPISQCGQFILEQAGSIFSYKAQDEFDHPTELQINLVSYINGLSINNIDQRGISFNRTELNLAQLVKEHYLRKGVRYVITKNDDHFIEIPIEFIDQCFNFSACLRRKKSGSRSIPKKYRTEEFKQTVQAKLQELNVRAIDVNLEEENVLITYEGALKCKARERVFSFKHLLLYLSLEKGQNAMKARVKGLTNSITLVYSLEFNGFYNPAWKQQFLNELEVLS